MKNLSEIFKLFFQLGIFAFGGPAAHLAMIHKEVVDRRKWMSEEHFLDLVGATALIPGPNSTEMAIHCGFHKGGVAGLFISGFAFIFPACLLTGLLAWAYTLAFQIPDFAMALVPIKAVVIVIIFQALTKLWKKAVKSKELGMVAAMVAILGFTGIGEIFALVSGTAAGFLLLKVRQGFLVKGVEPISIFLVFAKIGSVLFGGGYVLIAYLLDEIVEQRGWLTSAQIADAVAIGQFTPGPVLSTSTFIGYLLDGPQGAVLASVGIFLPSFLFVLILNPLIPKMRKSKSLGLLLDSVNAGAVGLMAYALYPLGKVAFTDWLGIGSLILAAFLTWKFPKKMTAIPLAAMGLVGGGVYWTLQ